jgi:hypothetical protein
VCNACVPMRSLRHAATPFLFALAIVAPACTTEDAKPAATAEAAATEAPSLGDFIAGNATWVMESRDVGLPLGESDTILGADGILRSYLHASTQSAGVRDSNGGVVEFPGCVTEWQSTDKGKSFRLARPTCLFACARSGCTPQDHTNQQQYPRVAKADDGTMYMAYEWGAAVHLRTSSDDGRTWSAEETLAGTGFGVHECAPEARVGECHGNEQTVGQCLVGAPPGIFVDGDELYVFADAGSCPAHMACFRGPRSEGVRGLRPCDNATIFASSAADQGPGILGSAGNEHFDFRFISSAEVVRDGNLFVMAYEGERGPATDHTPDEWGLGFAFSETLDAQWTKSDMNPVLLSLPGNVGFGHADILKIDGAWIMFDTVAEPTTPAGDNPSTKRGRWRLVWRKDTIVNGRTDAMHGTVVTPSGAPASGVTVTAWGHRNGDMHRTVTRGDGIYVFTKLDRASEYNVLVNADFRDSRYVPLDPAKGIGVRNDVTLAAGRDGWHAEDFTLDR